MTASQAAVVSATRSRRQRIEDTRSRDRFPVVIVGAGINGLGTFRDLSLQGLDCLIIDKGDFCSGTSAAPSRMIHGGLKYLETGEFRLVEESVHERNRLLVNAPHLVRPLEMVIPIRSWFGGEIASAHRFVGVNARLRNRGRLIVKAGLAVYDFFSRKNRVAPVHRMISGWDLRASLPDIAPDIKCAGSYFDAQIVMPERLALELALDGMAENQGSVALNYVSLAGFDDGKLVLRDEETGESFAIGAEVVVNAAGAWIDQANAAMQTPTSLIGGAKGSHMLLDLPAFHDALAGRMIYFDPGDGRICLVTSLAGKVLLGSTDIPVADPSGIRCEDDEIDYMLDALRAIFPTLPVERRNIVFTYSGVRPLPRSTAREPGAVSRDHSVHVVEPSADRPFAILSLIGGKWTTFRAFSEEAANAVLDRLGRTRSASTDNRPIGGGKGLSNRSEDWERLVEDVADTLGGRRGRAWQLVRRYGGSARAVAALCSEDDRPLTSLPDFSVREIEFIAATEMAEHLADVALRRTPIALTGRLTPAVLEELAGVMGAIHGWTAEKQREEISNLAEIMFRKHRIDVKDGTLK